MNQLQSNYLTFTLGEVVGMLEDDIEPVPRMGAAVKSEYIKGMGRQGEQSIIIVDVDAMFSDEGLKIAGSDQSLDGIAA